jgi:hypothetical protein
MGEVADARGRRCIGGAEDVKRCAGGDAEGDALVAMQKAKHARKRCCGPGHAMGGERHRRD